MEMISRPHRESVSNPLQNKERVHHWPPDIFSSMGQRDAGYARLEWLSWRGFMVGLIESFLYGAYATLVNVPISRFVDRKWSVQEVR
jgi:hypothetical protein